MDGALLLLLRERRRKRTAGSEAHEGKKADEAHRLAPSPQANSTLSSAIMCVNACV
jgi:hypothetical protein